MKHPLELNITPYADVPIASAGDALKKFAWYIPWRYIYDNMGRPQDVIFQRPEDVSRGSS